MPMWKIGDRVTRERRLDDGTWDREGDICLPGPLKHGEVVGVEEDDVGQLLIYQVRWDDPARHDSRYFGYGIDAEESD